jgi:hypothetical protein
LAWGLSNGYADLAYWGIATADTTTPLGDDNAPDPTRTKRKVKKPQAAEPGGGQPSAAAGRTVTKSERPPGSSPGPKAGVPPEPVWATEPMATPKLATLPKPATQGVPPRIPNWDRSSVSAAWADDGSDDAGQTSLPPRPPHVHEQGLGHGQRKIRFNATTAVVVLTSLLVVVVAVTIVVVLLRNSPSTAPRATPTTTVPTPDTTRLVAATQAADRVASTALLALHAMKGIPTPVTVAAVVNPYVNYLQSYAVVLSGADVPEAASSSVSNALAQIGEDVQFLSTINGLRAVKLGAYLEQFSEDDALFRNALGKLEHALGASKT